jgi:hypothetical protein
VALIETDKDLRDLKTYLWAEDLIRRKGVDYLSEYEQYFYKTYAERIKGVDLLKELLNYHDTLMEEHINLRYNKEEQ